MTKLCECGCGNPAPIADKNYFTLGILKGEAFRFILNHHGRTHGATIGHKRTPTYRSWEAMWRRTSAVTAVDYVLYGARGIRVCERWRTFEAFLVDMGERPDGKTLDRIDSNGNYEPGNCRWANVTQQLRNRACVKLNMEKAREIRRRYAEGGVSLRALGAEFGVNGSVVQKIIADRIWREGVE